MSSGKRYSPACERAADPIPSATGSLPDRHIARMQKSYAYHTVDDWMHGTALLQLHVQQILPAPIVHLNGKSEAHHQTHYPVWHRMNTVVYTFPPQLTYETLVPPTYAWGCSRCAMFAVAPSVLSVSASASRLSAEAVRHRRTQLLSAQGAQRVGFAE